jgi:hypothetical protein
VSCVLTLHQHLLDPNHAPNGQDRFGLWSLRALVASGFGRFALRLQFSSLEFGFDGMHGFDGVLAAILDKHLIGELAECGAANHVQA